MSAARVQAIAAMIEAKYDQINSPDYYGDLLDAIPPSVLAQLAIERGGIEHTAELNLYRLVNP